MTKKPVTQPQDKYVLRMPDGLRERIKAVAEREGTSMNHEIIRVLERAFPEQWPVDERLDELAQMLAVLSAGRGDPRLDSFIDRFKETVDGIVSGRVTGVDAETRESVRELWSLYRSRASEAEHEAERDAQMDYTEEELEAFDLTGNHAKYAVPPPKRPNPLQDTFHLMDILPRGPLSEMAEKLSKCDTEGAAEIVRNIPKGEIKKRLDFLALSVFEQERLRRDPNEEPPSGDYNPFKFTE
ncbi:Arc family DNA-binding protein [Rhizobium rhizogenes]|uniref:Arc-like DNA binding domain-containing protein n=1 Tax=Rhizobium rhizogenes NBRC 13257 TaxID=1220581 RepID=A0AA87QD38_RHIRH|nr:Arc family DNA-binding protein [Rhizobium rhizogenes]NTG68225.1 Arc family DNA-binding protein [Rhizobium rhizogenes]NTI69044.1 Arc family DNA-binding protein [Rhizobium rhizogenes]TRB12869.1 Arc family DNA-binding protein [Rhizobium rhizogenes]TRB37472.1 Arc family DNA-binding protein [Rhizobium rhizogenes]TRB52258.1 Arc family DNA-binding protein [Rhizobium rhizogenes]